MKERPKINRLSKSVARNSGESAPKPVTRPVVKLSPFSPQQFTVEGLAAASEYLRFKPDAVTEVRCQKQFVPQLEKLLSAVTERKIPLLVMDQERGSDQSREQDRDFNAPVSAKVILKAEPFANDDERFRTRNPSLVIALDHITDPRNLGAVVRSAAFFGVSEVLVPERRQVLLTQSAVATAQGGFALTDLVIAVNLARALRMLKDDGYWIVGAQMQGEVYTKLVSTYQKVVLVLGSEDTGLSRLVSELCDVQVKIPGAPGSLDSLNVSVAAGILLSAFGQGVLRSVAPTTA